MKRIFAVAGAVALIAALTQPMPAGAAPARTYALEAVARASVLAGVVDVQPRFDPALIDSISSSSNIGTSSLQSVVWPSFLVDAFFFLYQFQSVERLALGISEARFPQGPTHASQTMSDLVFAGRADPDSVPGDAGRSRARAGDGTASGESGSAHLALPGGLSFAVASSTSSVLTRDSLSQGSASQSLAQVAIGPLEIRTIHATASFNIDGPHAQVSERLEIVGATVAGSEVSIDDAGVHAVTGGSQQTVEDALAAAGLTVRVLPGTKQMRSGTATTSTGGLLVEMRRSVVDPTNTPRDIELGYVLGAASASGRATPIPVFVPPKVQPEVFRNTPQSYTTVSYRPPPPAPRPVAGEPLVHRRVVVTANLGPLASARGVYAALVFVALGLVCLRPLVRAASRN